MLRGIFSATLVFVFVGSVTARILHVNESDLLVGTVRTAQAGDTVIVAPGVYTGDIDQSGDPGTLPNGKGFFWIGNDGTESDPIVLVASSRDDPPVLQGSSIDSGYVLHVTGEYVVVKNIILRNADKGVVFDNASHGIIEDCTIYNTGSELLHVRDGSSNVTISRNHLYGSGNGGRGSIGEGIYIGTDQARWGTDDQPQSTWGEKAIEEGYGGYDWRVYDTRVLCNYLSGGISAELLDVKEGTRRTLVQGNMLVGDSIALKPGAAYYDDSFIDQKGVEGTFLDNSFCRCGNDIDKFISEVKRNKYDHIPDSLTADNHAKPWCDDSEDDDNVCFEAENEVVDHPFDPRPECDPVFAFDFSSLAMTAMAGRPRTAMKRVSRNPGTGTARVLVDIRGRVTDFQSPPAGSPWQKFAPGGVYLSHKQILLIKH
ncbi:MAG: hypothetical protein GF401_10665 [Chitinivibrionales bacterium]|nr:hypothetical protein [Chitinivibrionales bacterium]